MTSNQAETQQARTDLAAALRWIARLGMHEGVCNHFTVMLPERRFLINPKGVGFHRITASGLLVIDEHGKTLEGTGRPPTSGFAIHTRIHLLHPAAKVVLHLHAPYSTALTAIQGGRLQMIHQNAARFFGDIAYDDHFNGIAEATLEGERMAAAMGTRRSCSWPIMAWLSSAQPSPRHSMTSTIWSVPARSRFWRCRAGQPLNVMPDAMARDTHEQFTRFTVNADLMLEDIKATLDAEEPAYAS